MTSWSMLKCRVWKRRDSENERKGPSGKSGEMSLWAWTRISSWTVAPKEAQYSFPSLFPIKFKTFTLDCSSYLIHTLQPFQPILLLLLLLLLLLQQWKFSDPTQNDCEFRLCSVLLIPLFSLKLTEQFCVCRKWCWNWTYTMTEGSKRPWNQSPPFKVIDYDCICFFFFLLLLWEMNWFWRLLCFDLQGLNRSPWIWRTISWQ